MRAARAGVGTEMRDDQKLLLEVIDAAYTRNGWHGPTLRGALRGLEAAVVLWRPAPDRHNIWELAVHAAYWKYVVRRRLTGAKKNSFALSGSNWITSPETLDRAGLRAVNSLLDSEHTALRSAISALPTLPERGRLRQMLYGIAAHDLYHTGQIQLIKRLHQDD